MNSYTDPNASGAKFYVSNEPFEVHYIIDKLAAEFPRQEKSDLRRLLLEAKLEFEPSEDREQLLAGVRRLLAKKN